MADNMNNQKQLDKKQRRKAMLWSLLWANVAMLFVVGATLLFQYYDYTKKLKYATSVSIDIDPVVIIVAYIIGMLILWGIIYKHETKEIEIKEDPYQNHNIYY